MSNYLTKYRNVKGQFIRSSDSDERQTPNQITCKIANISRDTMWKIKVVWNSGDLELIKKVDEKKISINAAHKIIMSRRIKYTASEIYKMMYDNKAQLTVNSKK